VVDDKILSVLSSNEKLHRPKESYRNASWIGSHRDSQEIKK